MKILAASAFALALSAASLSGPAEAKGCLKGAVVGGVAGHMAGHGKLGAAAGCAYGVHKSKSAAKQNTGDQNQQR
jgi:hypothetical protein